MGAYTLNPLRQIVRDDGVSCVRETEDDDGDGVDDEADCTPRDPDRLVLLDDGVSCLADTDDGDGVPDGIDCAPRDAGEAQPCCGLGSDVRQICDDVLRGPGSPRRDSAQSRARQVELSREAVEAAVGYRVLRAKEGDARVFATLHAEPLEELLLWDQEVEVGIQYRY